MSRRRGRAGQQATAREVEPQGAATRAMAAEPVPQAAEPVPRAAEPVPVEAGGLALSEAEARRVDLTWAGAMVALLVLVYVLLSVFSGVSVPVLLAVTVAYVLNPWVTRLQRRGVERTWGSALVFAGGTLLLLAFLLYLVPVLRDQALKLPGLISEALRRLVPRVEELVGRPLPELVRQRTAELGAQASQLLQDVGPVVAGVLAAFASNTARVVTTLLGLLLVPVMGFFFLQDWPQLMQQVQRLVPRRAVGLVDRRFAEVDEVLSAFVSGQLTVGSILSVIYAVGLSLGRIEMALVIGAIAGFGNMVPYLGTAVGVVLAVLGVVLSWHGPWQLAVVVATFVVGQLAEGFVITPRVVGDKVGLSPVTVILAVLAFGDLFGFTGVLLAVPTAAILKVVLRVVVERYQRTALYTGHGGARP